MAETTANPRYRWERNKGVPRKIGSKLWLYDCINCDKCVPVCPNDANFVYETSAGAIPYDNFELLPGGVRRVPGGVLRLAKAHQLANYADACNDCGNCDVFCPEDGGPYVEKPRFFGSLETYRKYAGTNGFYIDFTAASHNLRHNRRRVLHSDAGSAGGPRALRNADGRSRNPSERQPGAELETEARRGAIWRDRHASLSQAQVAGRIGRRSAARSFRQRRGTSGGHQWQSRKRFLRAETGSPPRNGVTPSST